jgi:hypothetical protein
MTSFSVFIEQNGWMVVPIIYGIFMYYIVDLAIRNMTIQQIGELAGAFTGMICVYNQFFSENLIVQLASTLVILLCSHAARQHAPPLSRKKTECYCWFCNLERNIALIRSKL